MSLDEKFKEAAETVTKFSKRPENEDLLEIYGYYKQATVGDNQLVRPSGIDIKAAQKWDAWNSKKGMDCNTAKELYIAKVNELLTVYL